MLGTVHRKALESLLMEVAISARMITGVIPHCVSSAHSFHEATPLSISKGPMHQVDVVGNQLVAH